MSAVRAVSWATPAEIAAAARAILDMADTDPDAPEVLTCAGTALEVVDNYLGNEELPVPTPQAVLEATALVAVEVYRRKDAVFGVLNLWGSADFGPVRVSTDWLKGVESLLHPWMRDHFGVG